MNKDIIEFIRKQKTATVCTVDESGHPYCFSCFFAFDAENAVLYYKTHGASHHAALMLKKKEVAGTILPDKLNAVIVKGIQFEGEVLSSDHPLSANASKVYHLRYPFALAMPGVLWTLQLHHIKMTDSSKGFGTKIEWEREEAVV
ncbi:MAG: pyridoxamine 5'-phosphate oxidase family protein [Chitinophagaceae bacterium]|nr:pyridoxamine 5'-phosphate oxidase family protein [Chitinophagaceae bacterium]